MPLHRLSSDKAAQNGSKSYWILGPRPALDNLSALAPVKLSALSLPKFAVAQLAARAVMFGTADSNDFQSAGFGEGGKGLTHREYPDDLDFHHQNSHQAQNSAYAESVRGNDQVDCTSI